MKKMVTVMLALVFVCGLAGMVQAEKVKKSKLICITKKTLAGEKSVQECLKAGDRFAVIDEYGIVRILTPEEVELTKKINPGILEMRAFGMEGISKAPSLEEFDWGM